MGRKSDRLGLEARISASGRQNASVAAHPVLRDDELFCLVQEYSYLPYVVYKSHPQDTLVQRGGGSRLDPLSVSRVEHGPSQ